MTKTIDTPIELWRALQEDAGLELRRSKGAAGRDADLEAAILVRLGSTVGQLVKYSCVEDMLRADAGLNPPLISIEALLESILAEQQGFSAMMSDVLDTLVMAEAVVTRDPLSVSFSFDKTSEPLRLTLEAFRQQVSQIKNAIQFQWSLPTKNDRWRLSNELARLTQHSGGGHAPFPAIAVPKPAPASGHSGLDAVLGELTQLVSEFCSECLVFGTDRNTVWQKAYALSSNDPDNAVYADVVDIAGDAHDGWDAGMIVSIGAIAVSAKNRLIDGEYAASVIRALLSEFPNRRRQIQNKYAELVDVLNLPVWKKRHELYSVWVGTALLRVAKASATRMEFHPVNGVLSFAFGGSRLASYDWDGRQFDIWAEFRSDLAAPSLKRKKGIQPDFRVIEAVLGASDNAKTRFVLECKHYLKPSLSNFTQAASDYAKSCPQSDVFIVNHGPADHDLLSAALSGDISDRVSFLGEMTAGENKENLENAICETLFPVPESDTAPTTMPASSGLPGEILNAPLATIRLAWDETLRDLDLSLKVWDRDGGERANIDFASPGTARQTPFALLHEDVREGPGAEQIDIYRWDFDRYEIFVSNYSESPSLKKGSLRCTVALGSTFKLIEFPDTSDSSLVWNVGTIDVIAGVPRFSAVAKQD